jgi:hypothetical protein
VHNNGFCRSKANEIDISFQLPSLQVSRRVAGLAAFDAAFSLLRKKLLKMFAFVLRLFRLPSRNANVTR